MPWKVVKGGEDCPFEVQRADTGARVACHPTEGKAMDHMRALYANVPEDERADNSNGDSKKPYGDVKYADPKNGKYPIDTEDHARAALSYFSMPKNHTGYTAEEISAIMGRIKAACKKFGIEVSDEQRDNPTPLDIYRQKPRAVIETRDADVANVNYPQRIITVIAAPYEQPAWITLKGEPYQEFFERTAWNNLKTSGSTRIRVNRDHDKRRTVGKVINLWPERSEGLVADIKIAPTDLGDETLGLAADDCLSSSVGFGVLPDGEQVDRHARTRRIKTAFLDHISFVESPAYSGAEVIGVRSDEIPDIEAMVKAMVKAFEACIAMLRQREQRCATPDVDEYLRDDMFQWVSQRLDGK